MVLRRTHHFTAALVTLALVGVACTSSTTDPEAVEVADGQPSPSTSETADDSPSDGGDGTPTAELSPEEETDGGTDGSADGDGGTTGSTTTGSSSTTGGDDGGSADTTTTDGDTTDGGATTDGGTDTGTTTGGEPSGDPLKIGAVIPTGNPGAAFGVEGAAYDEEEIREVVRAVAAHTNDTGGLAGRPIEMAIVGVDNTNENQDNQIRTQNEACIKLTEDHDVFMVIGLGPTFWARSCYAEHTTPLIRLGATAAEESMSEFRPWLLPTFGINEDRNGRLIVRALEESGRYTDKMGLISFDHPDTKGPAKEWIVPGVERIGGKVIEEVYLPINYADLAAGLANATLRFKQAGVDNVIVWGCCGGGIWLLFAESAESNDYHPAYTISTYDAAGFIVPLLPEGQKDDIAGHGWSEAQDIMTGDQSPLNEREAACLEEINERAGTDYNDRTDSTTFLGLAACDQFGVIQDALAPAAGTDLGQADVAPLVYDVGDYLPTRFPGANFNETAFDALASYRHLEYAKDDCACMRYTTEVRTFPW